MIYEIWREWDQARKFILPALDYHRTHSEDDVLIRLASGEYRLWRTESCAVVTCFIQYPQLKALETRWAGGELVALRALQPAIERFALSQGCREIVSTGRDGWARVFPDFKRCGAIYFKEL